MIIENQTMNISNGITRSLIPTISLLVMIARSQPLSFLYDPNSKPEPPAVRVKELILDLVLFPLDASLTVVAKTHGPPTILCDGHHFIIKGHIQYGIEQGSHLWGFSLRTVSSIPALPLRKSHIHAHRTGHCTGGLYICRRRSVPHPPPGSQGAVSLPCIYHRWDTSPFHDQLSSLFTLPIQMDEKHGPMPLCLNDILWLIVFLWMY